MDIRPLTPAYAVSPQINPEDLPAIAAAGYTTVINNRPDEENPPSHQNEAMKKAAKDAGITLVTLPVSHATLTLETVAAQKEAIAASTGPVLAYCASGNRCTIVWALGQAGQIETDEIVQIAANNGYNLNQLRGQLDMLAQQG
ncbi:TIGR01244 family sulfur transferase [Octadecabacter sp. CECT 8868]|uniref:TIGR01244 family sulfur transferase n=1 Tax=Octadecabacter algicola TaxID=2909342 RepID=UPI001F412EFF|nr:TIGR01244 family sulfur transferase [Octadecabacter algicola]MCF2904276.1 TIGR01244 family sulfur transferase [Octadecabacter algicola]